MGGWKFFVQSAGFWHDPQPAARQNRQHRAGAISPGYAERRRAGGAELRHWRADRGLIVKHPRDAPQQYPRDIQLYEMYVERSAWKRPGEGMRSSRGAFAIR